MQDPYRVLGLPPTATDDEIKKAYRALAKKYHPDVNNGSAEAEARMKEVNEAYSQLMKMRRTGATGGNTSYGSGNSYNGGYGGYNSSGYRQNGYGQSSGYGYYSNASSDPLLTAARNYINAAQYNEALNVLAGVKQRNGEWYYLCAQANLGLGQRIAALNYARQAVNMEPMNFEYRALLARLEGRNGAYEGNGAPFNIQQFICSNPIALCCLCSCALTTCSSCCYGRGTVAPMYCCF